MFSIPERKQIIDNENLPLCAGISLLFTVKLCIYKYNHLCRNVTYPFKFLPDSSKVSAYKFEGGTLGGKIFTAFAIALFKCNIGSYIHNIYWLCSLPT